MWYPATEIEHQVKPEGIKLGTLVNNFKKDGHDKKKAKKQTNKKITEIRSCIDPNNSAPRISPKT